MSDTSYEGPERIAIVGMACRFPGAPDVEAFWSNLRGGVESIARFTEAELLEAGNDPELLRHPDFVPASGHLEGADLFDAEFFDLPPRDAELLDPQHRLFLEQAWAALEHAGCDPGTFPGPIGVFAGAGMNTYLLHLVARHGNRAGDLLQNRIRSDKDFLATLASYKLDLRGPSLSVQTACSTSLVAVHLACQSLLDFQCDAALAGGVAAGAPLRAGYLAREGVFSRDGRCRAFDAAGEGTVGGSGVGVVVLKRLSDALADGDRVHAVILGSAVNNDGAAKVGYSAPGVDGQVEVVAMAQAVADVPPESVTLLEAHGTATPMGDPVEVAALTRAFGTEERGFCALGSVKGNIGHLDAAAGVASLIKAVLALEHGEIPPTLHFSEPNPRLGLAESPFFVADRLRAWTPPAGTPRRAGVSAFGVGGTNAHVVLEEAPPPRAAPTSDGGPELMVLSARTPEALERLAAATADSLERAPEASLADAAFTLQRGRRAFPWRRSLVAATPAEAAALLRGGDAARVPTQRAAESDPGVAFLFSGLGTQYAGMGRGLYETEPAFRAAMDRCFAVLRDGWGMDLRAALRGGGSPEEPRTGSGPDLRALLRGGGSPEGPLAGARLGHPAMFAVGWALAEAWRARGVEPRAVAGHSLGEYVAACVAGVFSLEDALTLVVRRAELLEPVEGRMAAATLSEAETRELLDEMARDADAPWLAAVNAPRSCVVAGSAEAVERFGERARAAGAAVLPLAVRHPFHSGLLEPLREPFRHAVAAVRRRAPEIPLATGTGGGWLRAEAAQSVEHWVEHLVAPVRFAECVDTLRGLGADEEDEPVLLEVGPGATLGSWARQQGARRVASCLRHAEQPGSDREVLLGALGQLWGWGVRVDWTRQGSAEGRRRVVLPGHPLDRRRFWLDTSARAEDAAAAPAWGSAAAESDAAPEALAGRRAVVFGGAEGAELVERMRAAGATVVRVEGGGAFHDGGDTVTVRPASAEDHARLAGALRGRGWDAPLLSVHLPPEGGAGEATLAALDEGLDAGPGGLLRWARAAGAAGLLGEGSALLSAARAPGAGAPAPWQAMLGAILGVVEREHPGVRTRGVDVPAAGWEDAVLGEAARLCGGAEEERAAHPRPASAAGYVAPRGALEAALAELFGRALGIGSVGADDGFFELGGDSLVATQLLAAVNERFRVELPLRALFAAPTPARLAEAIARERGDGGADPLAGAPAERIPPRGDANPAPLSFAQQRIWLHDRLDPEAKLFHVPVTLRLRGELDGAALRRALDEIVRRHEVLRTVFAPGEDGPVQVVLPARGAALAEEDAGEGPGAADRALELARAEAARPFDLEREPGFRALLVRAGPREHVLVIAMHHIVQDRWSSGILLDELAALYTAFARGEASPLPEPDLQYADFAAWQRERLRGTALEGLLDFWRRHLEDAPEDLDVPADLPPAAGSFRVGIHPVTIPEATVRGLRAVAAEGGGTLYMALLAAYLLLLRRHAGQDDLVVGSNVAGRTRTETERLMGSFANTLALRFRGSAARTFWELFAEVRETVLEAHRHQDLPFDRLVEELQPAREAGRIPLVHASLDLHRAPAARLEVPGLAMEPLPVQVGGAGVDLHWFLEEADGGVRGALEYDARRFLPETAARLAGAFLRLLDAAAADPGAPLARLDPLPDAERRRVLEEWNDTRREGFAGECVHDLFRAQAARTPGAVAVSHRGDALTYAVLERRAAGLAHALRSRGVRPESRVGVCLERTPRLVVAMLAVLQAGGAYVPLDPALPRERLARMCEDAEVSLVLTSAALVGVLPPGTDALVLDAPGGEADAGPVTPSESGALPENLSHVIFTSGSTGRPKGVMIRHASVVSLLHWLRGSVPDEDRSAVLFATSVGFDVSVAEVWGTLCWGGRLVMVENALELAAVDEPVVHASMVPTAAAELLRSGGIPASVRTLSLGGEELPADLAAELYALGTVRTVRNLYGPTEDTTYSTCSVVERGAARVAIGRPVANTRAYVLDGALEPVPVGALGELYLAGEGLARGYAGRPERTAEAFLPDPFGEPGARMYRVRDRVRWRADGELEYFGRTDTQVKVRGFRIELGEVEAALRAHPGVRAAVAVVREDAPGDRRIAAYFVAASGAEPATAAQELRAWLGERLPAYMVPSFVVALETLPLTGSGKVDRRALPAPAGAGSQGEYTAPRNPLEAGVAAVFADVLGVPRVGVHDDFFDEGGHSLLAARVAARLHRDLGVDVPVRVLFERTTVAGVAEWMESAAASGELESWEAGEELDRLGTLSDDEVARMLGASDAD
ncbi:MAG: amino acid adenylation domain-containing protein [Longimicrobiaceae bacterium]